MKGLSIQKFWEMRPKLPFRFKTQFFTGFNDMADSLLPFTVTSINLPKMEGQASEGSMYLGDSVFTVPVWNIASRKLEITFEENDNMLVSQFIDRLNTESYGKVPWRITIVIHEYEEHFDDEKVNSKAYICHLSSYEEPSFKRDGAATQVTLSATFIIDTIIEKWVDGMQVTGNQMIKQNFDLNPTLDTLQTHHENEKFAFGDVNWHVDDSIVNGMGRRNKLEQFIGDNKNRDSNYDALVDRMRKAGINTTDTTQVVNYLRKEGYITDNYQKGVNGLCATSTYLVAAITSGQTKLGDTAGHGENQKLTRYGYKIVKSGYGAAQLEAMVARGELKVGDVINIKYSNGDKFGHAVTVIRKPDGTLGFASDFMQSSVHGQSNTARVGSFYIQRRA